MGYKETFGKDSQDEQVQFDNGAFIYFVFTGLFIINLVLTVQFLVKNLRKNAVASNGCQCSQCKSKVRNMRRSSFFTQHRLLIGSLLILSWSLAFYIMRNCLTTLSFVSSFDPYEILGVSKEATKDEIRKVFRKLSLLYHPDRNTTDTEAASKFILISKAYKTLSDPKAFENYSLTGNPDGVGSHLRMSIGLPSFLINPQYQVYVLMNAALFMLVTLPALIYTGFNYYKCFGVFGLRVETIAYIADKLCERTSVLSMITLIAESVECRKIAATITHSELEELKLYFDDKKDFNPVLINDENRVSIMCIIIYLKRMREKLSPKLREKVDSIVVNAEKITRLIMHLAFVNNWTEELKGAISMRRCLFQAVEIGSPLLNQISHFTSEKSDLIKTKMDELAKLGEAEKHNLATIHSVLDLFISRKEEFLPWMSESQIEDVKEYARSLTKLKLEVNANVEDESECLVDDILCVNIKVSREGGVRNKIAREFHAPYFPATCSERVYIFLVNSKTNSFLLSEHFEFSSEEHDISLKIPMTEPGLFKFTVVAMIDSVFGVDEVTEGSVEVLPHSKSTRNNRLHPEDIALDKGKDIWFY